jgi:hypothetical protein
MPAVAAAIVLSGIPISIFQNIWISEKAGMVIVPAFPVGVET